MDWVIDAACRHKHSDIWYPPMDAPSPNDYYTIGKLVCGNCPVWRECLSVASNETWGMWGGLTPQERRGTAKTPHGSMESYRKGCRCDECVDHQLPSPINLAAVPQQSTSFDVKDLLFALLDR